MTKKRRFDKPKRKIFDKPKKRHLPESSSRRNLAGPKPKRRMIEEVPDDWWEDRILTALKTPLKEGGGYLYDHGLWIFLKLTTYKVPRKIMNKLINEGKIKQMQVMNKHNTYKLAYNRREL